MRRSPLPKLVLVACLAFFYFPLGILIVNSFNDSRFGSIWGGFSFRWYERLLQDSAIWSALLNTMLVAVAATAVSTVLGTLAAFALHRWRTRLQSAHYLLVYVPLVVPEILMGMSLLVLFVHLGINLSLWTVICAHVTFCISYVAMVVLARFQDFDYTVVEAARDLGAGWGTTIRRVILPLLAPGIAAGALLAFTLSVDDFVVTFFVAGPGSTTLPIQIYSMMRHGSPPVINALSTLLIVVTFVAVWLSQRLREKSP